jgi:hypothetical protein
MPERISVGEWVAGVQADPGNLVDRAPCVISDLGRNAVRLTIAFLSEGEWLSRPVRENCSPISFATLPRDWLKFSRDKPEVSFFLAVPSTEAAEKVRASGIGRIPWNPSDGIASLFYDGLVSGAILPAVAEEIVLAAEMAYGDGNEIPGPAAHVTRALQSDGRVSKSWLESYLGGYLGEGDFDPPDYPMLAAWASYLSWRLRAIPACA